MKATQNQLVLDHLRSGLPITPMIALRYYHSMRLGARIYNLREAGWPIETKLVTRNGRRYAEYRMGSGKKPLDIGGRKL